MKTVLFDCDGVLVNTEEIIELSLQEAFADIGIPYSLAEVRETFVGFTHEEYLRRCSSECLNRTGQPLPGDFQDRLAAVFHRRAPDGLQVIAGIYDLLRSLKEAGIPFAVASNTRIQNLNDKLRHTGLHHFLDPHIYSREHVREGKPAPDVYLYAAEKLGADPADCIVVEDSPAGARAGVAAGMHVIGFARADQTLPADPQRLIDAGAHEIVTDAAQLRDRIFALAGIRPSPRPGRGPQP